MTNLKPLTDRNAPEATREVLGQAKKNYGFIPNLLGNMANALALLKAYLAVGALVDQTSLSPTERQVILLTVSAQNGCGYCVAAHTAMAGMQKVRRDVVEAIRNDEPIDDRNWKVFEAIPETSWNGEGGLPPRRSLNLKAPAIPASRRSKWCSVSA